MTPILIEYAAIRNLNTMPGKGGWIPQVWDDGRETRSVWCSTSLDKDVALAAAADIARETASRYIGDWHVTVRARPE